MRDFEPAWLLRGRHLQSVLASSGLRRRRILPQAAAMLLASRDEILDCGGGVRLLAHHAPPRGPASGRTAVLIHGWEGSGDANYMLASGAALWAAGYRVFRLNLRDHGDSHHLNREMFHSCRLAEVVGAVARIQSRYPQDRLFLGGYSLGGNFALRVAVAAPRAGLRLAAVAAVCPVLDPEATMYALDRGWAGYRLYFLRKWRRSLARKQAAFPGHYRFGDLRRFRRLQDMTDYFVREYTEFPDLLSYLRGYALTGSRLAELSVPVRMLLAEDDPVIPIASLEQLARPALLEVQRSRYGGHCGFIADYRLGSVADGWLVTSFAELGAHSR
ncbi:MAG: alpha/beta fold hydrolase [Gammaproteobacteria bacterium]|nr:MAG: alpha/beta fold hydrolase [Gammaproteobacteria bacterium]